MIKTLIFDIGNVLLFFDHEKMVNQIANTLKIPFSQIKSRFFEEGMLNAIELGSITTEEMVEELFKLSSTRETKTSLLNAYNDIFKENSSLTPILHTLKKQGKKLILLSNISEEHFNYIFKTYPTLHLFDAAILSYQERHAKPSYEIYQAALRKAECHPYECFYTDDILLHVESAKQLSIDAEQFLSTELLIQQLASRMIFV